MNGFGLSDAVLRWLLAVAAVVVVVAGLRTAAMLLLPLVVAAFLAIVTYPLVGWLRGKRVPTALAVGLTLVILLAVVLGPGLVVHSAAAQFSLAAPGYRERIRAITAASLEWLEAHGVETERALTVVDSAAVIDLIGLLLSSVAALLSNALLVLLVVAFILAEAAGLPQKMQAPLGFGRATVDRFAHITREVQRYLWIKTLVSLVTGILIGLWAALLGLDFAILWGLLAFLFNYIPNFGSFLAGVPAILLGLVQLGLGPTILLALGYLAVNMVLGNVIEPYLMGRHLGLSPLVVLLSLIFWGWVWGPVGMLLSVPITMVTKILLESSRDLRWAAVLLSDGRPVVPVPAPAGDAENERPHSQ